MTKKETLIFDESLISKVANNDINALKEIYTSSSTTIFSIALSITKNIEDAEDVLHDTFIKIYENANKYNDQGKPLAWIYTITKNLALMKLRSKKTIYNFDYSNSINHSYIRKDDKLILESAFKVLNDEELQIVLLYANHGLKHQEIADLLGLPLSTVLSKYHRSLKKMRNYLERTM